MSPPDFRTNLPGCDGSVYLIESMQPYGMDETNLARPSADGRNERLLMPVSCLVYSTFLSVVEVEFY